MKRIVTIIVFLGALTFGFAQTAVGVKLNTPLHTLSYYNNITSNESYDIEVFPKIGAFSLGAFAHFQLAKRWALQTELLYRREQLSFRPKDSSWDDDDRPYYQFDYVEIPLMMQFEGKKMTRGFTQLGFSPKISTRAVFRDKGSSSETQDMKSYFGTGQLHINFNIGGGLIVELSRWLLFAEGRYSVNLTGVALRSDVPYLNMIKAKNHALIFSVGAGYKLPKKEKNNHTEEATPQLQDF